MKLTRKLIPAFAMLLVSVVLMSTASFAWFSMNGNVTASGFSVEATAPAALWISKTGAAGSYGTTVTFTNSDSTVAQGAIAPITNVNTATANTAAKAASWTFQSLTETAYKNVNESGKVNGGAVTAGDLKDDTTNFYKTSFYLLLEGQRDAAAVEGKVVSATVTVKRTSAETTDTIYKALRVALVTAGGSAADSLTKSTEGLAIFQPEELGVATGAQEITTIAAQDAVQVYVYIWFEGEDDNCLNKAAQFMDDYTIEFAFSAAAISAAD